MKTAKANLLMFDIECPHCEELIETEEGHGSLSFSIHESVPPVLKCHSCGEESKAPARCAGQKIVKYQG